MKPIDLQKLAIVIQTGSNPALRDWRGQFTPESVTRSLRTIIGQIFSIQSQ